jgi:AsmA protein
VLRLATAASLVDVPAFTVRWADATLEGGLHARMGESPAAQGRLSLQTPSLRKLLATVQVSPPPMQDPATLGPLKFGAQIEFRNGALALSALDISLDDTQVTGVASVPRLEPIALRFDLAANQIDLDRYLEPDDIKSEPFELPLAQLKALDAKGVLRVKSATVAGARTRDLRIDVE